jgi:hypothetical protein
MMRRVRGAAALAAGKPTGRTDLQTSHDSFVFLSPLPEAVVWRCQHKQVRPEELPGGVTCRPFTRASAEHVERREPSDLGDAPVGLDRYQPLLHSHCMLSPRVRERQRAPYLRLADVARALFRGPLHVDVGPQAGAPCAPHSRLRRAAASHLVASVGDRSFSVPKL